MSVLCLEDGTVLRSPPAAFAPYLQFPAGFDPLLFGQPNSAPGARLDDGASVDGRNAGSVFFSKCFSASVCDGAVGDVATPTTALREDGPSRSTTDKAGRRGEQRKSETRPQLATGKNSSFDGGVEGHAGRSRPTRHRSADRCGHVAFALAERGSRYQARPVEFTNAPRAKAASTGCGVAPALPTPCRSHRAEGCRENLRRNCPCREVMSPESQPCPERRPIMTATEGRRGLSRRPTRCGRSP